MTGTSPESAYLDAARACILAVGWRRTTLTDIARRAGVSRMTIYRRWPDTQTLLADLLVREWSELLLESRLLVGVGSAPERIGRGVTGFVRAIRDNELWRKIVELDPELMRPYLLERQGRNQKWLLDLLAGEISTGQAEGTIRSGDPSTLASAVLLSTYGFLLSAHTVDPAIEELDAELGTMIERFLRP